MVSRNAGVQAVDRDYPCTLAPLFIIPPVLQVHGRGTWVQGHWGTGVIMKRVAGVMMDRGTGGRGNWGTRVQVASRGTGGFGGFNYEQGCMGVS